MDRRVLIDANVLWSAQQRNILLQLALKLDIELHWTALIIEEWLRNVLDVQRGKCETRTIPLMETHFPRACLPAMPHTPYGWTDPRDRHVAAASVHVAPSVLMTWNLRDFDATRLRSVGVDVRTPDQFLSELYDRFPDLVVEALQEARANLSRSAPTWDGYLDVLSRNRLRSFVRRLRRHQMSAEGETADIDDGSGPSTRSEAPSHPS